MNVNVNDIVDRGGVNIEEYKIKSLESLGEELVMVFEADDKPEMVVLLDKVVSFRSFISTNKYKSLRIDSDGSSYGLDVSIQLDNPKVKDYMVLYLFEEERTVPVFRALAKKIVLTYRYR